MAFIRKSPNEKGWSELEQVPEQKHVGADFPSQSTPLLVMHHLSDLHVCDAQSPLRPEFLDRWADPDSPIRDVVGTIGCYRPHAMLSPHVVESMIQALNKVTTGPLSGHPIDAAIITGDTTDNAQHNEVDWYLALLDGLEITPDSGDLTKYEGVMDDGAEHYDVKYWHPHGTPAGKEDDDARAKYGFPVVPGLLDACRKPFKSTGLKFPWYAIHGNHDALLQGTVTPDENSQESIVGDKRFIGLPSSLTLEQTLSAFNEVGPASLPRAEDAPYVNVTADAKRKAVERGEYALKHLNSPGAPKGHGFTEEHVQKKHMYYSTNVGKLKLIVIDSVNEFGGWQGSLDVEQFEWLENEIKNSDRLVILASHHPLNSMFNDYAPVGRRVCIDEITEMLLKYPSVIAWFAGHVHRHHVAWIGPEIEEKGFWQIETASHADWPQQSRTIEIVQSDSGEVFIALTVIDHAAGATYNQAQTPLEMAALSRLLSANVWQKRESLGAKHPADWALGAPHERNTVLRLNARNLSASAS
jgi:metallophosphoesterase (TIGR03767 family)